MDVHNAKELLVAVNEVSIFLIARFVDGLGADDAVAIWEKLKNDDEFKTKIMVAYEGYQQIDDELADANLEEGIELVQMQLSYVPKILAALKPVTVIAA